MEEMNIGRPMYFTLIDQAIESICVSDLYCDAAKDYEALNNLGDAVQCLCRANYNAGRADVFLETALNIAKIMNIQR